MTEYSITLPKSTNIHTPNLKKNVHISDNILLALSAFDIDGQKGLSANELRTAFDYFVNMYLHYQ